MYRFLLFLLLAFFSCEKRELPTDTNDTSVSLERHTIPAFINPGKKYTISVKATSDVSFQLIKSVSLEISKEGEKSVSEFLALYDDGGAVHPEDSDVVAYDGVFSNVLTWEPGNNSRENYEFKFNIVTDEELQSDGLLETVVSLGNVPPNILSVQIPEVLESGFAQAIFKVEAADSNDVDDVQKVTYKGVQDDAVVFQGELERSKLAAENEFGVVFTQTLDSTFAVAKKGEYKIVFQAEDKSNIESLTVEKLITIENNPPNLFEVGGPSEFERPNNENPDVLDTAKFLLSIKVNDEQSIEDIKAVTLIWKKPDGTFSNNSPFAMFDNGLPFNDNFEGWSVGYRGDLVANDGIYSITALFDENQPLGNYELTMYAEDFAGNESEHTTHIITLKDDE